MTSLPKTATGTSRCPGSVLERRGTLPRMQKPIGSSKQGDPHSGIDCIHVRQEGDIVVSGW
eukprot:9617164-Prorocentrum_lima.AAC.1